MNIGSWDGGSEFFRGTIDEVAIYALTLPPLEVKSHHDIGISTAVGVSTPTGLAATAASSTQVNLTWTDTSNNETGFVLERDTTSAFTSPTAINLAADAQSYNDTGRTAGTTYWYRVKAVTATDSSGWSNVVSAATPAPPPTTPAAPTGFSATATSTTQINLRLDRQRDERDRLRHRAQHDQRVHRADVDLAARGQHDATATPG